MSHNRDKRVFVIGFTISTIAFILLSLVIYRQVVSYNLRNNVYNNRKKDIIRAKGDVSESYFREKNITFNEIPNEDIIAEAVISFVGDLYPAGIKIRHSFNRNYSHYFKNIKKYISLSDLSFCNLELPIAEGLDYNYIFPAPFNGHPAFLKAVKFTGWNIINTANNHSADRGGIGIDLTIDALDRLNLPFVGTGKRDAQEFDVRVVNKKGISVAFLSYTEYLNMEFLDIQLQGRKVSRIDINTCEGDSKGQMHTANLSDIQRICRKIKHLKKDGIDYVVVYIHWGMWGHSLPTMIQTEVAKLLCRSGADIIVGSGPHCLQPIEKIITKDEEIVYDASINGAREHLVIYSLGDFITYNQCGMILYVEVAKTSKETLLKAWEYLPIISFKTRQPLTGSKDNDSIDSLRVYAIEEIINLLEEGEDVEGVEQAKRQSELNRLRKEYHLILSRVGEDNLTNVGELD